MSLTWRDREARRPLAAVLLFGCLAACAEEPPPSPEGPWVRTDLTRVPPAVETAPAGAAWEALTTPLGAAEVRDLTAVPAAALAAFPRQSPGEIRALSQAAGSRLRWDLVPGEDAYLSFVPLPAPEHGCRCTYRVGVRDETGLTQLLRLAAERRSPGALAAPAPVIVELAPWAGQRVSLLFQVDPPAGGRPRARRALWGSPVVWGRSPPGSAVRPAGQTLPVAGPPSVLLVGIDTLRADHVGPRGGRLSLTPGIDRLAGESDVFLDAYATFNTTSSSFASLMTGLYGRDHGIYDLWTPLPATHTTLAELFAGAGYDTLSVISARHLGDHNSGLGQGFGEVSLTGGQYAAELATDLAMDWIATRRRPFFLWLHLFDPHTPHTPPAPFALGLRPAGTTGLDPVGAWVAFREAGPVGYREPVLAGHADLYAGEVAYLDRQIDRLTDFLRSRGGLERTLVAVVADHGENLGEHGIDFRHVGLYETTLHVPLMIRWPGAAPEGRRVPGLVQHLDLFPTLLAAAGIPAPGSSGRDLRAVAGGGPARAAVFSEHSHRAGARVRTGTHSYYLSQGNDLIPDGPHLYDLAADPGETEDLAGRGLAVEGELATLLRRWARDRRPGAATPRPVPLDAAEVERLKSLGYLP